MRYKVVDIPDDPAIQQAFDLACERLNVEWVSYGFYELTDDPQEKDVVRSKWSGKPIEAEDQSGFMLTMSDSIWINADMSLREQIITIGHEAYHCYALFNPAPNTEAAAEEFGRKIWYELQAPQREKARINFRAKVREAESRQRKHEPKETKDELIQRLSKELSTNKRKQ